MTKLTAALATLLAFPVSYAQDRPVPINLSVNRNGKSKPAPPIVKLTVDTHAADLLVRDDRLYVPVEFVHAESFSLYTVIDREEIRIENLSEHELRFPTWTILLADHHYDDRYRASIPSDAVIRNSCLLDLTPANDDPHKILFIQYCRLARSYPPPPPHL